MELSNFARIGKGVISKAIGLQKNYTESFEKVTKKLNEEKSGCASCPICQLKKQALESGIQEDLQFAEAKCENCPYAVFETHTETEKKYINEKNKFGYQPTLSNNAIKLLLTYHFLQPDNTIGLIKDVSIKNLSKIIGCSVTTIRNCNQMLADYGYCDIRESGLYNGCVNVMLMEYRNYHKTAKEGGCGYITMPSSLLSELLSIKNVNTLRLNLKGILEIDNASIHDVKNMNISSVTISYVQLRGFLPSYCKRNVIIKALEQEDSILSSKFFDKSVSFNIPEEYRAKKLRETFLEHEEKEIKIYINCMNEIFKNAGNDYVPGEDPRTDTLLADFHIASSTSYEQINLTDNDYKDLAFMCMQYNQSLVFGAIVDTYNNYILNGEKIKKFGALIRTIIRSKTAYMKHAA